MNDDGATAKRRDKKGQAGDYNVIAGLAFNDITKSDHDRANYASSKYSGAQA
jgi:hypothetical protein